MAKSADTVNFNWNPERAAYTYAAVSAANKNRPAAATIKAGKVSLAKTAGKRYIKLSLNPYDDAAVSRIEQVTYDSNTITAPTTANYMGRIGITAPANFPILFDRAAVMADNVKQSGIHINGAIAESVITSLSAASCDTITTAKLKADAEIYVGIGNTPITIVALGTVLQFAAHETQDGDRLTLTSGSIELANNAAEEGNSYIYVGKNYCVKIADSTTHYLRVATETNAKGATSFTVSKIAGGESFVVEDLANGKTITISREYTSGNKTNWIKTEKTGSSGTPLAFTRSAGTADYASITSSVIFNKNEWK